MTAYPKRYDMWTGNEKEILPNKTRCAASVTDFTGFHFYQCSHKRGYGVDEEFCKQHAKTWQSEGDWTNKEK